MNKLNLGCGINWQKNYPEYDGLDIENYGQKFVGDILEIIKSFQDNIYDETMANHFLEHFTQDELKFLFYEINRILKKNCIFKFVVPHKDRPEAWDLTHKTFWNENTVKTIEILKGFGSWRIESCVTNQRKDIHSVLRKI
jgi:predicted SAM-dependent methyltransferase